MKVYESKDIRNVAVLGHGGSGKTILVEAMAYETKLIDRMGKIEDGTTISDYDPEESKRKFSISLASVPIEYENVKINLLDIPGYFDFIGEQQGALRVADSAIIVVDALSGIEVGTEKAWKRVQKAGIPVMFVINRIDRENVEFKNTYDSIVKLVGGKAIPLNIPVNPGIGFNQICDIASQIGLEYKDGKYTKFEPTGEVCDMVGNYRDMLLENSASGDEELMDKYLNGEELTIQEINKGIKEVTASGDMVPIACISAQKNVGINVLMSMIIDVMPSPLESIREKFDETKPATVFIYKTIADPYVGRLSLFKVMSGSIKAGMELVNLSNGKKEKINHFYTLCGKKQIEVQLLHVGDLGAFSKLSDTVTNDILSEVKGASDIEKIEFYKPNIFMSISPKSKGDEEKLGQGIARIKEEDPTIKFERNVETNQEIVHGMGEMHLEVLASKLKTKFGVEVELDTPIIPYRETIKKKATAEGKHKKQSGGSGQYGVVVIDFEPSFNNDEQLEFVDKVVGGTVPKQFIPAVEKGLRKSVEKGTLAGYPVVGLKATLLDGKYHPVDSDEMSFVTAASLAYKEGIPNASPVLLEPIYKVEIKVPDKYMGDVMGDLNKKRGKIMGMEPTEDSYQLLSAEAPLGEMFRYATELRSMTQARGTYEMEFARYEEVPGAFSEKIIAKAKAKKEEKK